MSSTLKIGWASRSIASEETVPITGQFHLRVSLGVYTPVLVSTVVMDSGDDAVIFVSADMVSVSPDILKMVKANLSAAIKDFPVEKIIINATHTHAGPSGAAISTDYPHTVEFMSTENVRKFVAGQITDAILEAWEKRAEGAITYGYGFATTGHSRRTIYLDDTSLRLDGNSNAGLAVNGKGRMYGNTNDDMFDGYEAGTDPFINLFYTFDKDNNLTGAIVNVPCPSQTGEMAWVLHASFWHNVREKLTAKYGNIGIICQAAAAGDLSPRQLHYRAAELRRYKLKYADKMEAYMKDPMKFPEGWPVNPEWDAIEWMRAEDIANRITAAFDEVLSWAKNDIHKEIEFKHEVKTLKLSRRMFPADMLAQEEANLEELAKLEFSKNDNEYIVLAENSTIVARRRRVDGVVARAAVQEKEPYVTTDVHVVRIGDIAFASNRFELYMDYMHRIQARSPFEQTFIVQLVVDDYGTGSYLATEKGIANKGYSASPYCNQVSPEGGQELVNETVKVLKELKQ